MIHDFSIDKSYNWINYDISKQSSKPDLDQSVLSTNALPNEKKCKGICRKNKTQKGYLCDKAEAPTMFTNGKKWCYINKDDVKKYERFLDKPTSTRGLIGNYYSDIIVEENSSQSMCEINGKISYNLDCSDKAVYDYYLVILLTHKIAVNMKEVFIGYFKAKNDDVDKTLLDDTSVRGSIYRIEKRRQQTAEMATKSKREILLFLADKLKSLIQTNLVNAGLESQDTMNENIEILKNKITQINESDEEGYGGLIKEMFTNASSIIKTNERRNAALYPTSLMDFFINKIPNEHAFQILSGAYFIVPDGGALYEWCKNNIKSGYVRFSSHKSLVDQYGFTDLYVDAYLHMVCGVVRKNGELVSWCQMEGSPMPAGLSTLEVFLNMYNGTNLDVEKYHQYLDHFGDTEYYGYAALNASYMGTKPLNIAIGVSEHSELGGNPIIIEKIDLGDFVHDDLKLETTHWSKPIAENLIHRLTRILGISYNYIKNNFTRALGIHSEHILKDSNQTVTPREYEERKQLQDYNYTGNRNMSSLGQNFSPVKSNAHSLGFVPVGLLSGRGGKYQRKSKKTRKNKRKNKINKKIKTMRHKK
jgi:hypothetical protein